MAKPHLPRDAWRAYVPLRLPWTLCIRERPPAGAAAILWRMPIPTSRSRSIRPKRSLCRHRRQAHGRDIMERGGIGRNRVGSQVQAGKVVLMSSPIFGAKRRGRVRGSDASRQAYDRLRAWRETWCGADQRRGTGAKWTCHHCGIEHLHPASGLPAPALRVRAFGISRQLAEVA